MAKGFFNRKLVVGIWTVPTDSGEFNVITGP